MSKLKDLEARLKKLEDEQFRQQTDLHELEDIKRLEAQLKNLSAEMDLDLTPKSKKFQLAKDQLEIASRIESKLHEKEDDLREGYVVCLLFNRKAPTEWSDKSGGGWRQRGKGTRYATIEEAKESYLKLKKKWPDYPLKVMKSV